MAKLLVDVGNTSVKWGLMDSSVPLVMSQQRYPQKIDATFFTELWENLGENKLKPNKVIVSCVASTEVWEALQGAVQSLWSIKADRVMAEASAYGLKNAYSQPADLGSDRWCALIGAYHALNSGVVVIDCGSAITIDIANESGEHLGGYILPGMSMMKQSLGSETAQVRATSSSNQNDELAPGKSTSECVSAAVNLVVVSFIEAVVQKQLIRLPGLSCVLTGGDANKIAEHLQLKCVKMPDIILRGLAVIDENK